MMSAKHIKGKQSGAIIVSILAVMIFLSTFLLALITLVQADLVRARSRIMQLQAQYAAESGADMAIAYFNAGNDSYPGTSSQVTVLDNAQYKATFSTTVTSGADTNQRTIVSTGMVYEPANASTPSFTNKIQVVAMRSSTTTAAAVTSRNIIDVDSGVKSVVAKDIYANGYIYLNKSTTTLTAENITIAGRDTSASNCSIDGSGTLGVPSSFSDPSQTKVNLNLAYNNCINPPGNTSNTNFNVNANQTNIAPIQSMYIPWSQYMDGTYTAAGSCSDWTSGAAVITIPSTVGSKMTHYPDSGSGISSACGNNGDLALGSSQYNITDNVHIRASLCAASACNPTFYNPDPTIKYVFVEGTINFGSLQTATGSGPIAFISYGTDPSTYSSVCPYGGAVYLGNTANTSAPEAYLLAMNGLCLDKTKFGTSTSIGGLGGKNIYISSNPGTPYPPTINLNFPYAQIPVNLAWRAASYERLQN